MHPIHPLRHNHGTLQGATPCDDRNGQPGKALLFDGIDDHIVAPLSIFIFFQFLYSLWAKPTSSTSTYGGVITFRRLSKDITCTNTKITVGLFGSVTVLVLGKPYKVRPLAYRGLHLPSLVMVPTSRRFRTEL